MSILNRKNCFVRWQSAWRQNGGDPGQPDQHLPPARCRPATVSHAVVDEPIAGAQKRTAQLATRPVETAPGGTLAFVAPVLHKALTKEQGFYSLRNRKHLARRLSTGKGITTADGGTSAYSVRNACIGSMRDALHAGIRQASAATTSSVAATAAKIAGSSGRVP